MERRLLAVEKENEAECYPWTKIKERFPQLADEYEQALLALRLQVKKLDELAVIVEVMIASKPRSGTPTFVTTFRLPSGAELQKPWQGATAAEAEFSRAILTVPLGARHVSTALRV